MIILIRGTPGSGQLDLARSVSNLYDWSVTLSYPLPTPHKALICGTDLKRSWIPGMLLDDQTLYERALEHHGWGADCVLCVRDDERRQRVMEERGLEVRSVTLMGEDRKGRSRVRSPEDALREVTGWLNLPSLQ